jgi:chloride channel 7
VIDERSGDILLGTVMKKVLTTLIKHKAFGPPNSDPNSAYRISPLVNWGTLECIYPKYPQIEDLTVSDTDR